MRSHIVAPPVAVLLSCCFLASSRAASLRDSAIASSVAPLYLDSPACAWTATEASLGLSVAATVPGDIISDLQRAGVVGDPWFELTWLDNRTLWDTSARAWNFSTSVTLPPPGAAPGAALSLVFEGIKMGARVSINGVPLGAATNQFVRYTFPIPAEAIVASGANRVDVAFDGSLSLAGRFMASSGGWDWAPLSQLSLSDAVFGSAFTFSSGIWKSVYVVAAPPAAAVITSVTPLTKFLGPYPVGALVDGAHAGFSVNVTAHLWAPAGGSRGTLTVAGAWGATASSPLMDVPAGDSSVTLALSAPASDVLLWWPNGLGAQPLYNVSATWLASGGAAATATRRIGFRVAALVTVNDTDPATVQKSTGADGSGSGFGMFFRVNGAAIYARGGNLVPMEELEGRLDADAYAIMVRSAADANMNMMRVWGGGVYPPDVFYDTCDERGVLLYHDLQFARGNLPADMPAAANASILAEIAHQVRRLSHHPSVALYDSNNEDCVQPSGPSALYATLVMTAVAAEDASRILWPNSPSTGWRSGVDRLWGTPNGSPLVAIGGGHDYFAGQEWHRFYQAGVGAYNWSTIIRDPWTQAHTFDPMLPPGVSPGAPAGVGASSYFVSEFGSSTMSSFESMSGTLAPNSWGLHGGGVPSTCVPEAGGTFYNNCTGRNAMAQRSWAADNLVWSYFGPALLNASGEAGFKGALFQSMIAGALNMQSVVESHRGSNCLGTLEWQLNEIWPTGGWGSLEYGSAASPGSLRGGRWKPMHYWFRSHIFADVMAACGFAGRARSNLTCYVNNARADRPFSGTLTLTAVDLATGAARAWATLPVSVAAGPAALAWLAPNTALPNVTSTILVAQLADASGGPAFDEHVVHLTAPVNLVVAKAAIAAAVAAAPNADGSVDIALSTSAVALFVTLTTAAPGRFSDNAFHLLPSAPRTISWVPFAPGDAAADYALLKASLRVEDHSSYALP